MENTQNIILIWPDGYWVWESSLEDQVFANAMPDDYATIDIPEFAWENDIEQFSAFWSQSNQTTQCAKDYWKDCIPNREEINGM